MLKLCIMILKVPNYVRQDVMSSFESFSGFCIKAKGRSICNCATNFAISLHERGHEVRLCHWPPPWMASVSRLWRWCGLQNPLWWHKISKILMKCEFIWKPLSDNRFSNLVAVLLEELHHGFKRRESCLMGIMRLLGEINQVRKNFHYSIGIANVAKSLSLYKVHKLPQLLRWGHVGGVELGWKTHNRLILDLNMDNLYILWFRYLASLSTWWTKRLNYLTDFSNTRQGLFK